MTVIKDNLNLEVLNGLRDKDTKQSELHKQKQIFAEVEARQEIENRNLITMQKNLHDIMQKEEIDARRMGGFESISMFPLIPDVSE